MVFILLQEFKVDSMLDCQLVNITLLALRRKIVIIFRDKKTFSYKPQTLYFLLKYFIIKMFTIVPAMQQAKVGGFQLEANPRHKLKTLSEK
jgi:hypothetical protein